MRSIKECFRDFEDYKSSGITTETALVAVFTNMRLSLPTIALSVGAKDEVLFKLIKKLKVQWSKLVRKLNKAKYGPIDQKSFERLHKQTNFEHHKLWLRMSKQKK